MKNLIRRTFAVTLALCFILAFSFSAGAVDAIGNVAQSLDKGESGNLVEYDYITKTKRIIPLDSIPDYASMTQTTYELEGMRSELARLAEMNASMNEGMDMDGGASTFSIFDSKKGFEKTPPATNNMPNTPYSGVMFQLVGIDLDNHGDTEIYVQGTGFMVAPDVMVTAGHCVINLSTPIVEVRVCPYIHQGLGFVPENFSSFIYPARWVYSQSYVDCVKMNLKEYKNHDWAVMKLQSSIADVYNFECSYTTDMLTNQDIVVSGYPNCATKGCTDGICVIPEHQNYYQVTSRGVIKESNIYRVWYTNNTKSGSSGSPVYLPSTRVCFAIHADGIDLEAKDLSIKYNSGTVISKNIYNVISSYINS